MDDLSAHQRTYAASRLMVVVLILLGGFLLRTIDLAAEPFQGDEVETAFLAFQFGHYGIRSELGVVTSNQSRQSPFFHDVFALSFAFDPDPRIGRLYLAVIHLVSMAVLYGMVRRYWSHRAALVALLLYVVMPRAVWSGRFMWNPSLVPPFMIGLYATGLLAIEGKRWARWLAPVMCCAAFQSHPVAVIAALLLPLFFVRDWIKGVGGRRWIVRDYLIGAVLAGLLIAPWGIGVLHDQSNYQEGGELVELKKSSPPERILMLLIDNPVQLVNRPDTTPRYIPSPDSLVMVYRAFGVLALLGSLYLLAYGIIYRRFPDFMIGVSFLSFPVLLLFLPARTYDHYVIPLLPATAVIQAVVLVGGWRRAPWLRLGALVVAGMCVVQTGYFLYWLAQLHTLDKFGVKALPPLSQELWVRDEAKKSGNDIVYFIEGDGYIYREHVRLWIMLNAKDPRVRVINGPSRPLPVADAGITYVGYSSDILIPELYANRPARAELNNYLRIVDIPPHSAFTPTCKPVGPNRLGNGATILGYYTPAGEQPVPGQPWTIYMLWQGKPGQPQELYQMFNHLVDDQDKRHGQNDVTTIFTDMWRDHETYVSKITIMPDAGTTTLRPLHLRVGMYTLKDSGSSPVSVVDGDGNPVAAWITIPLCVTL
ncbi:MAG: glycosyltransferase family 39 protein [Anaerolineae bacterium]|nr:glycosyltransferase family 39 protein [Anaerolineae bacterium]